MFIDMMYIYIYLLRYNVDILALYSMSDTTFRLYSKTR